MEMMDKKDKATCAMVQDLLPAYIEGLTSEETTAVIKAHLETCEECRAMYEAMTGGDADVATALGDGAEAVEEAGGVDYLKKVRSHTRRNIIIAVAVCLLLAAGPLMRFFVIGAPEPAVVYDVDVAEDASAMTVTGRTLGSSEALARLSVTQDEKGVVTLTPHNVNRLFYRSDSRTVDFTADKPITEVRTSFDQVIWAEGREISTLASDLYGKETPYVGDNSAMGDLIFTLDMGTRLALRDLQFSLQTDSEPYGMTIYCDKPMMAKVSPEVMESNIRALSCVILAKVDNLDSVTVRYLDDRGETHKVTTTASEATKFTGKDIKSRDDSAASMQELLDKLGIAAL